ncbi:MAG: phosphatidate cytidylyltransferase, partial [Microbacterium sp.]|nr:phosphatidate cytidylyltransferase [Microbacterium sp.]
MTDASEGSTSGTPAEGAPDVDPVAGRPARSLPAHVRAKRSGFEQQVAHARAEFEEANARITQRTGRN